MRRLITDGCGVLSQTGAASYHVINDKMETGVIAARSLSFLGPRRSFHMSRSQWYRTRQCTQKRAVLCKNCRRFQVRRRVIQLLVLTTAVSKGSVPQPLSVWTLERLFFIAWNRSSRTEPVWPGLITLLTVLKRRQTVLARVFVPV